MRTLIETVLFLIFLLSVPSAFADTFNLYASLDNGSTVTGSVSIDTVNGTVTGGSASLYNRGSLLSTFGVPVAGGVFSIPGFSPSYVIDSAGTNNYLFVAGLPTTSLVNYAGGELCSTSSTVNCAYSDLFQSNLFQGLVVKGILAPVSDTVKTFDLEGSFANGDSITGTVTIDTTLGFVLDGQANLVSGGSLVSTFSAPVGAGLLIFPGLSPAYVIQSNGSNGYLLNIAAAANSLVDYPGGNICAENTGLSCPLSDIFKDNAFVSNATTGSLTVPSSVPEPSSLLLLGTGAAGLFGSLRRKFHR
jgi:hypothetical protein